MSKQNICELLLRKHIKKIKPYSTARDEYRGITNGAASIFLNANENPYQLQDQKYDKIVDLNRYPDPSQEILKNEISKDKGVAFDNIFLGNGSDEATDILIRMFCEPGRDSVITMPPTYGMYDVKAKINNVKTIEIPLVENENNFGVDRVNLLSTIDTEPNIKLLFICTPNNPTGSVIDKRIIFEILNSFKGFVVIDEAYIDFSESKSFISELNKFSNLIILQTMSKSWGLADLRIGVCFAKKNIVDYMNRIKPPCNIGGFAQKLAIRSIRNKRNKRVAVSGVIADRIKVIEQLQKMPIIEKVFKSQANFVFVKFNDGDLIYRYLLDNGIVVRNKSKENLCQNCLRITIGTKEENKKLLSVLQNIG